MELLVESRLTTFLSKSTGAAQSGAPACAALHSEGLPIDCAINACTGHLGAIIDHISSGQATRGATLPMHHKMDMDFWEDLASMHPDLCILHMSVL